MKKLISNWVWDAAKELRAGAQSSLDKVGSTLGIPLSEKIRKQMEYESYLERKARGEPPPERKVTNEELES